MLFFFFLKQETVSYPTHKNAAPRELSAYSYPIMFLKRAANKDHDTTINVVLFNLVLTFPLPYLN